MQQFYITKLHIEKVRHLENLDIEITSDPKKLRHLILTGKNGSGKTSLLEAIRAYLNAVSTTNDPYEAEKNLSADYRNLQFAEDRKAPSNEIHDIEKRIAHYKERIEKAKSGLDLEFSIPQDKSGI